MKQSRLFPPALVSFMAIVLVSVSHLSAAVTSWDDFDSAASGYDNFVHHWGDNPIVTTFDLDEFNTFIILRTTDSVRLHLNPDEFHGNGFFHNILINETFYAMPDELLTLGINLQTLTFDWSSGCDSDTQSTSEPPEDIVYDEDADYIKSMRTPAPSSLLLVAIGLLSLCDNSKISEFPKSPVIL